MLIISGLLLGCGPAPKQPDIVLVAMDTTRWDHTSLSDYRQDTTPNLARLADLPGSITFERAYSPAPWSMPSYASVFTGLPPEHHGMGFTRERLDPNHRTLAEVLAAYGYRTAGFSSGPHLSPETDFSRGFSTYAHRGLFTAMAPQMGSAMDWLASDPDTPALLFVHGYDAHPPFIAPSLYAELFQDPSEQSQPHDWDCSAQGFGEPTAVRDCAALKADFIAPEGPADALTVGGGGLWIRVDDGPPLDLRPYPAVRGLIEAIVTAPTGTDQRTLASRGIDGAKLEWALRQLCALGLLHEEPLWPLRPTQRLGVSQDPRALESLPDDPQTLHRIAHYDSAVYTADLQLGRLLESLERTGRLDDTLIVAFSDHGAALRPWEKRLGREHGPGFFHVPLVVHLPRDAPAVRSNEVVSLASLMSGLLGALEIQPPVGAIPAPAVWADASAPPDPAGAATGLSDCCRSVWTRGWELREIRGPLQWLDHASDSVALDWGRPALALYADGSPVDHSLDRPELVDALLPALPARAGHRGAATQHGPAAYDPAFREILREGGYWAPEPAEEEPP